MDSESDILGEIDRLLEKPCWVIDLLPCQVPEAAATRFFEVERHFVMGPRASELRGAFADILLKLNCYRDFVVVHGEGECVRNPAPELLRQWVLADSGTLNVVMEHDDVLISVPSESTCMSLYGPTSELLELVTTLATASGLFVWRSPWDDGA